MIRNLPHLSVALGLLLLSAPRPAGAQQTCYGYDQVGQLVVAVNEQGQTIIYDYDAVGNIVDVQRNDAATATAITFVTPTTLVGAAPVQIFGVGFSSDPNQDSVTIGGVPATVRAANTCSLTVTVPPGALAGPQAIHVTTPSGSATYSGSLTVAVGLIVSPASAEAVIGQSIGFFPTVTGTTDQRVSWSVNGVAGGDSINGTITSTGIYTAPASVPAGVSVTIQAASVGFPGVTGQATVTVVTAANGYANSAVSVAFGPPPSKSVLAQPVSVQFGPLPPGGANALPVSVLFDATPPPLSVVALPVSVQFGPLSAGGATAAPVSVAFGVFPGSIVYAAPVSVANAAVIDGIAPGLAARGSAVSVTLTGKNFTGATAWAFLLAGAPDSHIATTNITVNGNGTQVTADVAVDGAAALGPRVVVVKTAAGRSALASTGSNGFSITP